MCGGRCDCLFTSHVEKLNRCCTPQNANSGVILPGTEACLLIPVGLIAIHSSLKCTIRKTSRKTDFSWNLCTGSHHGSGMWNIFAAIWLIIYPLITNGSCFPGNAVFRICRLYLSVTKPPITEKSKAKTVDEYVSTSCWQDLHNEHHFS